jgi:hypothetical protein
MDDSNLKILKNELKDKFLEIREEYLNRGKKRHPFIQNLLY